MGKATGKKLYRKKRFLNVEKWSRKSDNWTKTITFATMGKNNRIRQFPFPVEEIVEDAIPPLLPAFMLHPNPEYQPSDNGGDDTTFDEVLRGRHSYRLMGMFVCLFLYLSVYLSICLLVRPFVCPSVRPLVGLSVGWSVRWLVYPLVGPSVGWSVRWLVCLLVGRLSCSLDFYQCVFVSTAFMQSSVHAEMVKDMDMEEDDDKEEEEKKENRANRGEGNNDGTREGEIPMMQEERNLIIREAVAIAMGQSREAEEENDAEEEEEEQEEAEEEEAEKEEEEAQEEEAVQREEAAAEENEKDEAEQEMKEAEEEEEEEEEKEEEEAEEEEAGAEEKEEAEKVEKEEEVEKVVEAANMEEAEEADDGEGEGEGQVAREEEGGTNGRDQEQGEEEQGDEEHEGGEEENQDRDEDGDGDEDGDEDEDDIKDDPNTQIIEYPPKYAVEELVKVKIGEKETWAKISFASPSSFISREFAVANKLPIFEQKVISTLENSEVYEESVRSITIASIARQDGKLAVSNHKFHLRDIPFKVDWPPMLDLPSCVHLVLGYDLSHRFTDEWEEENSFPGDFFLTQRRTTFGNALRVHKLLTSNQ